MLSRTGATPNSGHSDTEVLLLSYIEWGLDCVDRFNGIWAFGVWRDKGVASLRFYFDYETTYDFDIIVDEFGKNALSQ